MGAQSNDLLSDSTDRASASIGAQFTEPAAIMRFITGGRAIITLVGRESRYTFQVNKRDATAQYPQPAFFLSTLTGPDNTSDYKYVGLLDCRTGRIQLTRKSMYTPETSTVKAWNWFMGIVWSGRMPVVGECWHVGRCGRCGRAFDGAEFDRERVWARVRRQAGRRRIAMITIHIYFNETLTGVDHKSSWLDALTLAYAVVVDNPCRVAHLFPAGSTQGLYIARHDDEYRRGWDGIDGAVRQAESMEFR